MDRNLVKFLCPKWSSKCSSSMRYNSALLRFSVSRYLRASLVRMALTNLGAETAAERSSASTSFACPFSYASAVMRQKSFSPSDCSAEDYPDRVKGNPGYQRRGQRVAERNGRILGRPESCLHLCHNAAHSLHISLCAEILCQRHYDRISERMKSFLKNKRR